MSTPAKSFEDLRSILGKLDRKIDSARCRRLGLDPEPTVGPVSDGGPLIGKAEHEGDQPPVIEDAVEDETEEAAARRRSPYGRAKPLNRGGSNGPNGASGSWLGGA